MIAELLIALLVVVIIAAAIDTWRYVQFTHEDPTAVAIDAWRSADAARDVLYPPSQKVHKLDAEDDAR